MSLRPATPADEPLLLAWYASTREAELALTPWTEEQKRAFVQSQFAAQKASYAAARPLATHSILCVDGAPAGRIYVERQPGRIHILDLTVAPELRNRGIGAEVLRALLDEADTAALPVSIYVESFNPSLRFFARHGFGVAKEDGFLLLLERPATPATEIPPGD